MYSFLEKKEDFYRGFTSKPRQMPIKSINSRKFNYLLTFNSLSYIHLKMYELKLQSYSYKIYKKEQEGKTCSLCPISKIGKGNENDIYIIERIGNFLSQLIV